MKKLLGLVLLLFFNFSFSATFTSTGAGTWNSGGNPKTLGTTDNVVVSHAGMEINLPNFYSGTITITTGDLEVRSALASKDFNTLAMSINQSGGNLKFIGNSSSVIGAGGTWIVTGGHLDVKDIGPGATNVNPTLSIASPATLTCPVSGSVVFGGVNCIAIAATLPIELLSFTGSYSEIEKRNVLTWVTATETNNDYFVIERMNESGDFEPIAQLDGAGNSLNVLSYSVLDPNADVSGVVYYRLVQFDYDGQNSSSHVVAINGPKVDFVVYPNPATEVVKIKIGNLSEDLDSVEGNYQMKLIDLSGHVLLEQELVSNLSDVDVSGVAAGIFFVEIRTESQIHREKITITD